MHDRTGPARVPPTHLPRAALVALVAAAVLAAAVVGTWWGLASGLVDGIGAAAAVLVATGVLYVAVTLPGTTPEGLLLGLGIPLAAMMAWTHLAQPIYVWTVTAVVGVVATAWTWPWWREWRDVLRLGSFWLAVALWASGALAALLLGKVGVLAGRVAYGGLAVVVALLVFQAVWRRGRDVSVGIVTGLMICHALLLALGAPYVFETDEFHATSNSAWGYAQSTRFWGGPWLVYHPNFIAMTGVLVAVRIGADARFAPWQRWAAVGNGALLLYIADSRTSLLMAGVASVVYGLLHIWRSGLPRFRFWTWFVTPRARRTLGHALIPLVVTFIVFGAAGGTDMLLKQRYVQQETSSAEPTAPEKEEAGRNVNAALSGRVDVWSLILQDFRGDTTVEKALGNTDYPRGEILRYRDPNHPWYEVQPQLSADNVAVGAVRRGGVVGLVAVLAAALVLLWRATRREAPVWVPVVTFAGLASVITEDEFVGTTPLWLLLIAGEAWVYARHRGRPPQAVRETPAQARA